MNGKTASLIGLIISVISIPLTAAVFYIAYKGNYERIFVLVGGGLALLCLIGLFVSYKGASKMKKSGTNDMLGKIGLVFSSLSLIATLCLIGICSTTVPPDNIKLPEKQFNNEMDDMLKQLNEGHKRDSLHADSVQKGLLKQ